MAKDLMYEEDQLLKVYGKLRRAAVMLDEILDGYPDAFTNAEQKELDKAVVLGHIQYKMIKRILHSRGIKTKQARLDAMMDK